MAATKESEKKIHSCKYTFRQNFTPKAIALTNGDDAVKMETTYLILALAEYTHKKHRHRPAKSPVNLNDHN